MGVQEPIDVLVQVEFEVFGNVQGCGFTKFCRENCVQFGINGWVKNSKRGTVMGKMQGPKAEVAKMVDWLSNVGSPGCKIEKCEFDNWGTLTRFDYKDFSIRF